MKLTIDLASIINRLCWLEPFGKGLGVAALAIFWAIHEAGYFNAFYDIDNSF